MKQERNTNKTIWAKRIWLNKNTYDFITISLGDFERTVEALEEEVKRGSQPSYRLEKASWFYSAYRENKQNAGKAIVFIIGAITGAVITEIIHLLFFSK